MNTLHIEERLWEYIDGTCSITEKADIERLMQTQAAWKEKYAELMQVHELINTTGLEEPSMRFSQNVMEDIARFHIAPATRSYINKKVILGIGGFFLVMIVGLLVYGMGQLDWSAAGSPGHSTLALKEIDWSKYVNNTYTHVFMMINIVLGLMLLDKYLTRKKGQAKHHGV